MSEAEETAAELRRLEEEAERVLTVREIFNAGFKAGLSRAGLASSSDASYDVWLLTRGERQRGHR